MAAPLAMWNSEARLRIFRRRSWHAFRSRGSAAFPSCYRGGQRHARCPTVEPCLGLREARAFAAWRLHLVFRCWRETVVVSPLLAGRPMSPWSTLGSLCSRLSVCGVNSVRSPEALRVRETAFQHRCAQRVLCHGCSPDSWLPTQRSVSDVEERESCGISPLPWDPGSWTWGLPPLP